MTRRRDRSSRRLSQGAAGTRFRTGRTPTVLVWTGGFGYGVRVTVLLRILLAVVTGFVFVALL